MDGNNQPQQQIQPTTQEVSPSQQPIQPTAVLADNDPYRMPPKKGLSKGAIWGIVGGVTALVLIVVAIVLAIVFLSGPTKDDYRRALYRTQDFNKEMQSYTSTLVSPSDPESTKEKIDTIKKKIDDYLTDLGKEKAMSDREVKRLYDEMVVEYKQAKQSLAAIPNAIGLTSCSYIYVSYVGRSTTEVMKDFEEKTSKCSQALKNIENESNEDLKKYGREYSKYLSDYRDYLQKRTTGAIGIYPPEGPGSTKLYNILRKITDSGKKISTKEKELIRLLGDKAGIRPVF